MSVATVLLIILILLLVGALPNFGYTTGWAPSGGIGLVVVVLVLLILLGKI